uniref:jerky protein homolog isoform X1 n=1 Tax=Pristiophorus japonicus TaxID=55135 RepID=UPI00398E38C9
MSKRPTDAPMGNGAKRKHNSLSIAKKVELLQKLDNGTSVRRLSEKYGVGISTIYDIKNQKEQIMNFYAESDVQKEMNKRKSMHKPKSDDLDRVMMEWWRQRRSEKVPLSGPMVMEQAKIFHAELEIETPCSYSSGWLTKFKRRHGISQLKVCGDKAKLITDENLSTEQIYNADQTALFWHCIPRKTLATAEESQPMGVKDGKDGLTVLGCVCEAALTLKKDDVTEVMDINNDAPVVHTLTDDEIVDVVLRPEEKDKNSENDDDNDVSNQMEKVSIDKAISICDELINALVQRYFISEQEIMQVYKIQEKLIKEKLIKEKPKLLKQLKLADMFERVSQQNAKDLQPTTTPAISIFENPIAGPSSTADIKTEPSSPSSCSSTTSSHM